MHFLCNGKLRGSGGECLFGVFCWLLPERLDPIRMHRMPGWPISEHNCAIELHILFNRTIYRFNRSIELQQLLRRKLL